MCMWVYVYSAAAVLSSLSCRYADYVIASRFKHLVVDWPRNLLHYSLNALSNISYTFSKFWHCVCMIFVTIIDISDDLKMPNNVISYHLTYDKSIDNISNEYSALFNIMWIITTLPSINPIIKKREQKKYSLSHFAFQININVQCHVLIDAYQWKVHFAT